MKFVYVALFGMMGVLSRFALSEVLQKWPSGFPVATFLINLAGAFLAGLLYSIAVQSVSMPPELRIGLAVGFLGGFTTFSSFCVETLQLLQGHHLAKAILYFTASPILGLICCVGGVLLGRVLAL